MATTKKKVIGKVTEMQANEALRKHADADSRIAKINAEIELKVSAIRDKYKDELAIHKADIDETFEILEAFAEQNEQLFVLKKSIDMQHGTIGFRTNPPSVKQHKGVKVETSIELMRKSKVLQGFVVEKTTYSLDKTAILAQREDPKFVEKLDAAFVSIVQDETFFVEPKKEA